MQKKLMKKIFSEKKNLACKASEHEHLTVFLTLSLWLFFQLILIDIYCLVIGNIFVTELC